MLLFLYATFPSLAGDFTYTYEGQTITYTVLDEDAKTVQTKKGARKQANTAHRSLSGALILPAHPVDGDGVEYTLTEIGSESFAKIATLTSVQIPGTVTTISSKAFYNSTGIESVEIPESVISILEEAFADCENLKHVTLPSGLTTLSKGALASTGLTEITLPAGITSIEESLFEGCEGLTSIKIPDAVTKIGNAAFQTTGLRSIEFGPNVTSIGNSAFSGCYFTTFEVPNSVVSIGKWAFTYNYDLKSIHLGNSLVSIGEDPLSDCIDPDDPESKGIQSITIGKAMKTLDTSIFDKCYYLQAINVESGNTVYSSIDGVLFNKDKTELVKLPLGKAGDYTIPSTVKKIGSKAFYYTFDLQSLIIPASVTSIASDAFNSIYDNETTGWTSVTCGATTPPAFTPSEENYPKKATLYVPKGKKAAYTNAGWNNYFAAIQELSADYLAAGQKFWYEYEGITFEYKVLDEATRSVTLVNDKRTATIASGDVVLPAHPEYNGIQYTLTEIPDGAFCDFSVTSKMTSIKIPNTVKTIGDQAFRGCNSLTSVEIPNSVTSIGEWAFAGTSMTSITLPEELSNLGGAAFKSCKGLKSVIIPCSVTLGGSIFAGCTNLESVEFIGELETIPYGMFEDCTSLKNIKFPNSLKTISSKAFHNTGFETIVFPNSLTTTSSAFSNCHELKSVTLGSSFSETLSLFYGCEKLQEINVVEDNPNFASEDGVLFNKNKTILRQFPQGRGGIYTVPESVTELSGIAFNACSGLKEINLPNSLQIINSSAFSGCTGLKKIELPESLTQAHGGIFSGCTNLYSAVCHAAVPPTLSTQGYFVKPVVPLYVPAASVDAYKATKWGEVFSDIRSIDDMPTPLATGAEFEYEYEGQTVKYVVIDGDALTVETKSNRGNNCSGKLVLPANPRDENGVIYDLVRVGESSFRENDITEVEIPESVTEVGYQAFGECASLISVKLPENLTELKAGTFDRCSSLTSINIPNSVTIIEREVFSECEELSSITLPESLQELEPTAFTGCVNLSEYRVAEGNTNFSTEDGVLFNSDKTTIVSYPNGKAQGAYTIPGTVTNIGGRAFYACTNVTSIEIPESVEEIGYGAFAKCILKSVDVPNSVKTIGDAFAQCIFLKDVTLGENVTSVHSSAFEKCESLRNFTCKATTPPTYVMGNFYEWGDPEKTVLYVPEESIAAYKEDQYWGQLFTNIVAIGTEVPEEVNENEFEYTYEEQTLNYTIISAEEKTVSVKAGDLEQGIPGHGGVAGIVVIPGKVTHDDVEYDVKEVGTLAFYGDNGYNSITDVTISSGIETIGVGAFACNKMLKSVILPATTTKIQGMAFGMCNKLNSVTCYATTPPVLEVFAEEVTEFFPEKQATLYVPVGAKAAYQESDWSDYFTTIEEVAVPLTTGDEFEYEYEGQTIKYVVLDAETKAVAVKDGKSASGNLVLPENPSYSGVEYVLTEIAEEAFAENEALSGIQIPSGVTTIGDGAFWSCTSLANAALPSTLTTLGNYVFQRTAINAVTIPASVETIGENPFGFCGALTEIAVEQNNTRYSSVGGALIDNNEGMLIAYPAAYKVTSYTVPDGIVTIGTGAFAQCNNLTTVVLPSTLKTISSGAFGEMGNLQTIDIPESVENIEDAVFSQCPKLETVKLPQALKAVNEYVFKECTALKSVDFPSGVETIGEEAFMNCTNLTSVSFGTALKTIGNGAFKGCSQITEIVLPETTEMIDYNAFSECTSLKAVTCQATNPPTVQIHNAFPVKVATLYVPAGTLEEYKATNWPDYFQNIVEFYDAVTVNIEGCGNVYHNGFVTIPSGHEIDARNFDVFVLPDYGYYIAELTLDDNVDVMPNLVQHRLTLSNLEGLHTLKVVFAEESANMAKLTVSGADNHAFTHSYKDGTEAVIEISTDSQWEIHEATFNGEPIEFEQVANNMRSLEQTYMVRTPALHGDNNNLNMVLVSSDDTPTGVGEVFAADNDVNISILGDTVTITGLDDDATVSVYDISGKTLYRGFERQISLQTGNVYLLSTPGKTFKFSLQGMVLREAVRS